VAGATAVSRQREPWKRRLKRLFYSWSVLFCLPTGMADQPSAGTGAVMRPDTLRSYAITAGFRDVETLSIENDFWRFYRLRV
jgi:hypothetical protein